MNKNRLLVMAIVSAALAFVLAPLLCGGWGGMMGARWIIEPMGGVMSVGLGEILIIVAGIVIILLAAWVLRSGGRQK